MLIFVTVILEGRTRLDPEDLSIWREAGLMLDNNGFVMPAIGSNDIVMKDDMISNALIWILSKVVNFIAISKELPQEPEQSRQQGQQNLITRWNDISHELDIWYNGLPDSFRPVARLGSSQEGHGTGTDHVNRSIIPEIWFSSPMCGSTMQTYHFARILLLVNKPRVTTNNLRTGAVSDFLKFYRTIENELRYRSREIFGIAISATNASIYLHQTQTIFVAGQCLVDNDERRLALDILRKVNSELGWETEYRVQQLLKEWNWKGQ